MIKNGRITSIKDAVGGRELLAAGRTAGFNIYEDYPPSFDAWETEVYSLDTEDEIVFSAARFVEKGPLRASVLLEATFGRSKIECTLSLDAISVTPAEDSRSALRLDVQVDWHVSRLVV